MFNVYKRDDLLSKRALTDARDRKLQKELIQQKSNFIQLVNLNRVE